MIAAIQAGGRSLRMGEDKAWLLIDGRPMIEHVLAAAQTVAEQLVIVINSANPNLARYEQLAVQWETKLLFDLHDHRGPLGGIETVLQQCGGDESALILACDLPFLTAEFLQLLHTIHTAEQNDLTVPLDRAKRPQMLAAMYAASCLSQVSALLAAEELKVRWLQTRVKTRRVRFAEYEHLAQAERLLSNVNLPADFKDICDFPDDWRSVK
jgi:molybdopterin-guanine dinucleotide biosynthesis protein A